MRYLAAAQHVSPYALSIPRTTYRHTRLVVSDHRLISLLLRTTYLHTPSQYLHRISQYPIAIPPSLYHALHIAIPLITTPLSLYTHRTPRYQDARPRQGGWGRRDFFRGCVIT
eukprot:353711-Rhodomonas_salina.1